MKNILPAAEPFIFRFEKKGSTAEGFLVTSQRAANLPFPVKRVFWVYDTPQNKKRGGHANKVTQEIMVALTGTVKVETETGTGKKQEFELSAPETGLYIPPYCWLTISFSPGATLICLASTDFEEADYIHDLEVFRKQFTV